MHATYFEREQWVQTQRFELGLVEAERRRPLAVAQSIERAFEHGILFRRPAFAFRFSRGFLEHSEVCQCELHVNHIDIPNNIDRTIDMRHLWVLEAPHHLDDGIAFPNVRQELVA
jgi:hypothetical protein